LKNGWKLLKIDNNEEPRREFYFKTKKDGDRTKFSLMKKQEPEPLATIKFKIDKMEEIFEAYITEKE
jgi:hypothetical protein